MAEAAPAVVCRGLTKRFGPILALDHLDLSIAAGSIHGFLGPNGAGKTTTLRLLTSLAVATSGEAQVGGVAVGTGAPNRRGLIGYLDQDPRFPGWLHGDELLRLVGRLHGLRGVALQARVVEVLGLMGLTEAAGRPIAGYSGGMRQRLGLAQAVLAHPRVLLLDEPVTSLDPEGRVQILGVIRGLVPASTVVLSTHLLADAERICDQVTILDRGRLVTSGPMGELLARFAAPVYRLEPEGGQEAAVAGLVAALRGQAWVSEVMVEAGYLRVGISDPMRAGRELVAMIAAHEVALVSLQQERPTLEDVFLRLVASPKQDAAA